MDKKIAIIDAEIVGKNKHRFPNLASMKISSYHKGIGDFVKLIWEYDYFQLSCYDVVYISKVFTKTEVPEQILNLPNVIYGGTGFYYDNAEPLPYEIEHSKPDYHLYDEWIDYCINEKNAKIKEFAYYKEYSIGYLTRGCFRQCEFCVNRNKKRCVKHSSVYEFMDNDRQKLCFLDDNFFACPQWKEIIAEVKSTGKRFQFKQGLDERLLDKEKIEQIVSWKYDGDFIFAFDNIEDKELIEEKLKLIFKLYPDFKKSLKFYVFCGFDKNDIYDDKFWIDDIKNVFIRCFILAKYSALPYIMRYEKVYQSEYSGIYSNLASWCNQPNLFKKFNFKLFCQCRGMSNDNYKKYKRDIDLYLKEVGKKMSCWKYYDWFVEKLKQNNRLEEFENYFNIVPDSILEYGNGNVYKE